MIMKLTILTASIFLWVNAFAQTNIISTNSIAEDILLGNYTPNDYEPSQLITNPKEIANGIMGDVSPDSLKSYLVKLGSFYNRNTGSDTSSSSIGIGAARRWVYSKFKQFGDQNESRLLPSYLQFDKTICNVNQHRNIFAVLPGSDVNNHEVIIVEAHMDSRCEDGCDSLCQAEGIDDNGTGTALVIELSRVMSKYYLKNTVVFLVTIGEEQGLHGADAFADYCYSNGVGVKAVLNNDIVGGITCGETSSPPSCSPEGHVDSTQLRIFSNGKIYSINKGLARFMKMQYQHEVEHKAKVPMTISLMDGEDREGRGGDHIPFGNLGYRAIRFTSANEHGNGNPSGGAYKDRQHSTRDVLGIDTDNDGVIDSFFVDFNYLKRNTVINGVGIAMAAIGPKMPDVDFINSTNGITVDILTETQYMKYKVGIRTDKNDFDVVYTFRDALSHNIPSIEIDSTYYISIASVDSDGIESLFTKEKRFVADGTGSTTYIFDGSMNKIGHNVSLLQNRPNPYNQSTTFEVIVNEPFYYDEAYIEITDVLGKIVDRVDIDLSQTNNSLEYFPLNFQPAIYNFGLIINSQLIRTNRMVFSK
ncbi:MAG: hypothetical protein COC01_00585 [Bacteroidetes bacterium]|nr:MAG: hypothetical protein COC01_00585 [Bacteroidota bacterium]